MNPNQDMDFKNTYIDKLTEHLSMLRAKAGVSQAEIAKVLGIARQTYSAIECGRKKMSWNTFLSLVFFFRENPKTNNVISVLNIYNDNLANYIKGGKKSV